MALPTGASLPPDLELSGGYQIVFVAFDATTGADLSLPVSSAALQVKDLSDKRASALEIPGWLLVPAAGP